MVELKSMNRTDNQTRKVFQRMNKAGLSAVAIAAAIGRSIQTIYNLSKVESNKLLIEPSKNTRKPTIDLDDLKKHITDKPFEFNKEVGLILKRVNQQFKDGDQG
jgi:transposase